VPNTNGKVAVMRVADIPPGYQAPSMNSHLCLPRSFNFSLEWWRTTERIYTKKRYDLTCILDGSPRSYGETWGKGEQEGRQHTHQQRHVSQNPLGRAQFP
jgi:hypothetical protein